MPWQMILKPNSLLNSTSLYQMGEVCGAGGQSTVMMYCGGKIKRKEKNHIVYSYLGPFPPSLC